MSPDILSYRPKKSNFRRLAAVGILAAELLHIPLGTTAYFEVDSTGYRMGVESLSFRNLRPLFRERFMKDSFSSVHTIAWGDEFFAYEAHMDPPTSQTDVFASWGSKVFHRVIPDFR